MIRYSTMGDCCSSQEKREDALTCNVTINLPNNETNEEGIPNTRCASQPGPFYGKYHCRYCNRHWGSRCCWPNQYQICKTCEKPVYPHTYRPLVSNDFNDSENSKEHQRELCQMCRQLGHLCTRNNNRRVHTQPQRRPAALLQPRYPQLSNLNHDQGEQNCCVHLLLLCS